MKVVDLLLLICVLADLGRASPAIGGQSPPVQESLGASDALQVSPLGGFTASGQVGGPFGPISQTYSLTNLGATAITWQAAHTSIWLTVVPASGVLPAGSPATSVTVSLLPVVDLLPEGVLTSTVLFSNATSGMIHAREFVLRIGQPDYFTERLQEGEGDLDFQTFTFRPNGSSSFYQACREEALGFPTDPAGGSLVTLSDDSFARIDLAADVQVALYGRRSTNFFIGSNGYITFEQGDTELSGALIDHFNQLRIAALFDDLDPSAGGAVTWKQLNDRVAVTFFEVPESFRSNSNSFQLELFFDGTIRLTYLQVDAADGLVGLSSGEGLPSAFVESDFSSFELCLPPLALTAPEAASEGDGVLPGMVRLVGPLATNLTVHLSSSASSELTVPATVIIPAGATSAAFAITVGDDGLLDGTQSARLSASAPGWRDARHLLSIFDNESAALRLQLPVTVSEQDGLISGLVILDAVPARAIRVSLDSSDRTEIQLPPLVFIPAGQTSALFSLTIVNDSAFDGAQTVLATAAVMNWTNALSSIRVLDDEAAVLIVHTPGQSVEGAGVLTNVSWVEIPGILSSNLQVALASSDTSEVIVPATVTIPSGQSMAVFVLSIVNDDEVDGVQTNVITAQAAGWVTGRGALLVFDDESPPAPSSPWPAHLASNVSVTVNLSWSSGRLMVNGNFETGDFSGWIKEDQGSGTFRINDGAFDPTGPDTALPPRAGNFSALSQQSGPGQSSLYQEVFVPGSTLQPTLRWADRIRNHAEGFNSNHFFRVEIRDTSNVVRAVAFSTDPGDPLLNDWIERSFDLTAFLGQTIRIAFVQESDLGFFNVHLDDVRIDTANIVADSFDVFFGTDPSPAAGQFMGNTTNAEWILPTLAPSTTYYWRIVARNPRAQTPGPVWQFSTKGVDRFEWSTLPFAQLLHQPFAVRLAAKDEFGSVVSNFSSIVRLSGVVQNPSASSVVISEIGVEDPDQVEFINVSVVPVDLSEWEIILYDRDSFPAPRLTFRVPPGTVVPAAGVFRLIEGGTQPGSYPSFRTGIDIHWTQDVRGNEIAVLLRSASGDVIDFFCAVDAFSIQIVDPVSISEAQWHGAPVAASTVAGEAYQRIGNQDSQDSSDWISASASLGAINLGLVLPFAGATLVAITPTNSGNFSNGVWTGQLTVLEPVTEMQLVADDGHGHIGLSETFEVMALNDIAVAILDTPDPVAAGSTLTYTITVANSGPAAATGVVLTNVLTPQVRLETVNASQGVCRLEAGALRCELGQLQAGAQATVTVAVTPTLGRGTVTNRAMVGRAEPDGLDANNRAEAVTTVLAVATMPFFEDWESGQVGEFWRVSGAGPARALVNSQNGPHGGNYHLTLDAQGGRARNEVTLTIDLAGWRNVRLRFWAREWEEEADGPPVAPFFRGADFDGIAVSPDGVRWYEVQGLRNLTSQYGELVVDLDAAIAAHGITYTSAFQIRFNQVDDRTIPDDGIGIDDISITGVSPGINVERVVLSAESCGPPNGAIDPGESVTLDLTLVNTGRSSPSNLVLRLLESGGVRAPSAPRSYGMLRSGDPAVTQSFTFTAEGDCGSPLRATFLLADGPTDWGVRIWDTQLGQVMPLLAENFDLVSLPDLPLDWTRVLSGAGSVWSISSVQSDSPPKALFAPDPSSTSDNRLLSPLIAIHSSPAQLSFRHWFLTEQCCDRGVLEISIGSGAFTEIMSAGGRFVSGGYNTGNGWAGESAGFMTTVAELPPVAAGQEIQLQWKFTSDGSVGGVGWYVDSILVSEVRCCLPNDLSVTISDSPDPFLVGPGNLTYTITVANSGPAAATGVVLTNVLPLQARLETVNPSQGVCRLEAGALRCELGQLQAGAQATVTVAVTPTLGRGTVTNRAMVGRAEPDSVDANNRAEAVTTVLAVATMPFFEDWESGQIGEFWRVSGAGPARALVNSQNGPHGGNYHLTLDAQGGRARNEVTLTIDLAGWRNVRLRFWAREWEEEADGPPVAPFFRGADFDGVAVSPDGVRWYEVQGLRNLTSQYGELVVDLDAAMAAHGITYTSAFQIRFNQVDDSAIARDGIGIDDISITGQDLAGVLDHFHWNAISSPHLVNIPFSVLITAKDVLDQTVTNHTNPVNLSALAHPGIISPSRSDRFTNGAWAGVVTVSAAAANLMLAAEDGQGHTGVSNPFDVVSSVTLISLRSPDSIKIAWPRWAEGLVLYSSESLTPPIQWTPVLANPSVADDHFVVTVPLSGTQKFYILTR